MAPFFKKSATATAEIELLPKAGGDNYNASLDHFLSDETVTGSALFTLPHGAAFASSTIVLKGTIKTTTEEPRNGSVSKQWRTEMLTFLGVSLESKAKNTAENVDGTIRVPFRFNLTQCEKLATLTSKLPPSIDSRQEGQRSNDPQYEVTYTIVATAFSARKQSIASTSRKIYIDPVSADSFSDSSSDTPGEYFWAKRAIARSKSLQTPFLGPQVELAGQEPSAIALHADDSTLGASTDVPFIVKLSPQNDKKLSNYPLPQQCVVKANLTTKTHMTPDGIKSMASSMALDYIRIEGQQITKTEHSHQQNHSIPIERWEKTTAESAESFAVARFSFPFTFEGGALPSPTFFTPILSRRHYIDLVVSFEGSDETFKLQVPLEITHGSADPYDSVDSDKVQKEVISPPSKIGPVTIMERRMTAP